MIIKKLKMYNFRQYKGIQSVEFSTDTERNVTVLIGVNTSGKTTIIRAFEWCLYGGKSGFDDPVLLNSEVRDKMHYGETQDTWVSVTFIHNETEYCIKRTHTYTCNERTLDKENEKVILNKRPEESVSLQYLQPDGQTKPIPLANISISINNVLPKELSDYFFFGGERISGIANRTDLSKAVRGLMGLEALENGKTHVLAVIKEFEGMIDTTGDERAQKAKDGIATYKRKQAVLEKERDNYDSQMEYWKEKENEYNVELAKSNIEEIKKAKSKQVQLENTLRREKEGFDKAKKELVKAFNNRPYAFFGMPAIKKSLEMIEKFAHENKSIECVPDMEQGAIDHLIHRGYCICGTKLEPGTTEYRKIMEERRVLPPEYIGSAINTYKMAAEGYLAGSENFKENIDNKFSDIRDSKRRIGELLDEVKQQAEKILDDSRVGEIERKRQEAHKKYIEVKSDYDDCVSEIGRCKENIKNCEMTINKFAASSNKNLEVSQYIMYAKKTYEWLSEKYKAKEDVVRSELQKRVNDNFAMMYHGERAILIDEKYNVKYKDITTEESDGLKAVKSFAFIASLVSMAKDKILDDNEMKLGQVYPIVMDAPFSNVDEIHINNICKILPHTANQVIMAVMQKDWEYAKDNLQKFVGKSYIIEKDRDADGKEIDTSTHIR